MLTEELASQLHVTPGDTLKVSSANDWEYLNPRPFEYYRRQADIIHASKSEALTDELERCLLRAHALNPTHLATINDLSYFYAGTKAIKVEADRFERLFKTIVDIRCSVFEK